MSKSIYIEHGQTIFDVALQQHGSIEGIFNVIDENEDMQTVNANTLVGQEVLVSNEIINQELKNYYQSNNVIPTSGISISDTIFGNDFDCSFYGISCVPFGVVGSFDDSFGDSFEN